MTAPTTRHKVLRFGGFELDETRGALLRDGHEIHLRRQAFGVLQYLAENAGRLVSKDEIFAAVWGKTVVTDDSLTQCLVEIRRTLGDESREVIRTVPRRGYVFECPVEEIAVPPAIGQPQAPDSAKTSRFSGWLLATIGIAFGVIAVWWFATRDADDAIAGDQKAPRGNSIAVLAFADMSEGGDHEYFADGISEEILNLLTRNPGLRVVARTSSFSFKGKDTDIATIGKTLDVGYVLEGSVRRSGDQVRVTTQLVDATTSMHIWSETYDRAVDDLLTVQSEIAGSVARSLKITLAGGSGISAGRAVNPDAYGHFLHARFLHSRRSPGDLAAAEAHFRRALEIDPDYAPAWAGLAGTLLVRIFEDGLDWAVGLEGMREAVTRALALDPSLPEAQMRASHYHFHSGNLEQALEHWGKAKALDPDNALVLGSSAGVAIARGDYQLALKLQLRAAELDPLNPIVRTNLSHSLARVGRYEEAARELQRARELNPARSELAVAEGKLLILRRRFDESLAVVSQWPEGPDREQALALVYRALGRADEAEAETAGLRRRDDRERARRLAEIHAQQDEIDEAFAWVAVAHEAEKVSALTPGSAERALDFVDSPLLRPLHGDPRWKQYLWTVE
jgi:TolB-like protein/DNA-binding winged helix-turn-helix (wHTH) protein/Flp pilus assembly protein TadD